MAEHPETIALATSRLRRRVAVLVVVGWLALLAGSVLLVRALIASVGSQRAATAAGLVAVVMCALAVGAVSFVREFSDAALTFTESALRTHVGKPQEVRWARIEEIDAGRRRQEVVLRLHGSTRPVPIGGTRWLSDEERADLVADLERRRRRALRRGR